MVDGVTKKHLEAFALALARSRPERFAVSYAQWLADVSAVADVLGRYNPGFSWARWLTEVTTADH